MRFRPRLADLPETLPLFPLGGALLLPRAELPLHIFEPRYLLLVEEALGTPQRLMGMICPAGAIGGARGGPVEREDADDEDGAPEALCAIGCAGRITRFAEVEDGRLMITLGGVARFRLDEEVGAAAPYRRARVRWSEFAHDLDAPATEPEIDRAGLMALAQRFLVQSDLALDIGALSRAGVEDMVNVLAILCPFEPADKQALLEAPDLAARCRALMALFRFALLGGEANREVAH